MLRLISADMGAGFSRSVRESRIDRPCDGFGMLIVLRDNDDLRNEVAHWQRRFSVVIDAHQQIRQKHFLDRFERSDNRQLPHAAVVAPGNDRS